MAAFEADQESHHPDIDHSETATRHLDIVGTWLERYAEADGHTKEVIKDFLRTINEQDKIWAVRRSMEASDRTIRIARLWRDERDNRRGLEFETSNALEKLALTQELLGEAVTALAVAMENRGGIFRRVWRWLFGGLTTDER